MVSRRRSSTVQGELWSTDPESWAEKAESRLRPLYEAMLDLLALPAGARLLDAGCGSGLFVALATERGANTAGLDAAPGLIEYARRRVPAAELVVGDLEDLPFADEAFDAVTAFNSILYAADPQRALAELARVTSQDGKMVVTLGSGAESAEYAAMIDSLLPPDVEASSRLDVDLHDPDQTQAAMQAAGLAVTEQSEIDFTWIFPDVEEAVRAQLPAGPVQAAARHSAQAAVEAALRDFFEPRVRSSDGVVFMNVVYRYVLAERQSSS